MKYIVGFFLGVIVTALFFTYRINKMAVGDSDKTASAAITDLEAELPDDFEDFYLRFHEDSTFQVSHVLFPLRGLPTNADSATITSGSFHWQKENWRLHQPFNPNDGEFFREFLSLSDELVTEDIYTKDGFGMQRRFMKTDGDWYLIYYSAMNKMR